MNKEMVIFKTGNPFWGVRPEIVATANSTKEAREIATTLNISMRGDFSYLPRTEWEKEENNRGELNHE